MADRTTQGREFLTGVLQHLPDELRGGMEQFLNTPAAVQALNYAGDGALRHNDYASQADKLRVRDAALQKWAADLNEYRLQLDSAAPAATPETPTVPTTPAAAPAVSPTFTMEQVEERVRGVLNNELQRREHYYAQFTADAVRIGASHLNTFNKPLDPRKILEHPRLAELGFEGAYRDLYKSDFDTLSAADAAKAREVLKQELRQELQAEAGSQMPYPLGQDDSPLASLGQAPDQFTVDAAVRHYNQLTAPGGR